jgi:hypothetical protein
MQAVLDLPSFDGRASLILPAGLKEIRGKLNDETLRLLSEMLEFACQRNPHK